MLAKGNRSRAVTDSCWKFGGFYLGSIGGPAARLGKECITAMAVLEYDELGMEAIYEFEVEDMPVTVAVDSSGESVHQTGPAEWRVRIEQIGSIG